MGKLTPHEVKTLAKPGRDGDGFYLMVGPHGSKS